MRATGGGLCASGRPSAAGPGQIRVAGHSGAAEREQRAMSGPARQIRRRQRPVSTKQLQFTAVIPQQFAVVRHRPATMSRAYPIPRSTPSSTPGERPGSRPRRRVGRSSRSGRDPAALGPAPRAPRGRPRRPPVSAWPLRTKLGDLAAHAEAWRFDPGYGGEIPPFGSARTRPARVGWFGGARWFGPGDRPKSEVQAIGTVSNGDVPRRQRVNGAARAHAPTELLAATQDPRRQRWHTPADHRAAGPSSHRRAGVSTSIGVFSAPRG